MFDMLMMHHHQPDDVEAFEEWESCSDNIIYENSK